jgi:hypothetical protein
VIYDLEIFFDYFTFIDQAAFFRAWQTAFRLFFSLTLGVHL